jgi:hypothetical protein
MQTTAIYRAGVKYDLSCEVSKRHLMILPDAGANPFLRIRKVSGVLQPSTADGRLSFTI